MNAFGVPDEISAAPETLSVPRELLDLCDRQTADGFFDVLDRFEIRHQIRALVLDVPALREAFSTLLWREAWTSNAELFELPVRVIDPAIAIRLELGRNIDIAQLREARRIQQQLVQQLDGQAERVFVFPTLPVAAPAVEATELELDKFRARAIASFCIAGLSGRPQLSVPMAASTSGPRSLSLLARRGGDRTLLRLASRLEAEIDSRRSAAGGRKAGLSYL